MGVLDSLLTLAAVGAAAYVVVYYIIPQIKANPDLIPSLFPPAQAQAQAQPQQQAAAPAAPALDTQALIDELKAALTPPAAAATAEPETDTLANEILDESFPPPAAEDEGLTASDADIVKDLIEAVGGDPDEEDEDEDEDDKDDDDDDDDDKDSMGISKKKLKEQDKKSKKQQKRHEETLKKMDPKKDSRSKAELAAAQKKAGFYATRFHPWTYY